MESTRQFQFENVDITITEHLTAEISGAITQHGAHLWPAAPVLAASLKRLYPAGIGDGGACVELGCGCALPGMVASRLASEVVLTDKFDSGLEAARSTVKLNQSLCPVKVEQLSWGDDIKPIVDSLANPIKLLLAADCLYPDMSAWPDFFCTLAQFCALPSRPVALVAFHKRNGQQTLEPFVSYWRLKLEPIPLSELDLEKSENIGGTRLPGPSTGSIILYRITYCP